MLEVVLRVYFAVKCSNVGFPPSKWYLSHYLAGLEWADNLKEPIPDLIRMIFDPSPLSPHEQKMLTRKYAILTGAPDDEARPGSGVPRRHDPRAP
jgi:hypothetical protein